MNIQDLKNEIVSTFRPFNPVKIVLFGSAVRGEQDAESDIDLIIVYNTEKRFMDRLRELYLEWNIPSAVDILAYTPDEFETMARESSFIKDVLKSGEVIYESA